MTERFTDRVRRNLRDELLAAAADLLVAHGFRGLRMADVAARVGVSRQTVYNEFGDKNGLAQALVLHETNRLLTGIDAALEAHGEPLPAVTAAVAYVLSEGANPLVKAALTGDGAEQMLPLLTTRGDAVLVVARDRVADHLFGRGWATDQADLAAETAVRLCLSHLMLPLDPVDSAAAKVATAVVALLATG
jgi:AcrR family transcriptional regulator